MENFFDKNLKKTTIFTLIVVSVFFLVKTFGVLFGFFGEDKTDKVRTIAFSGKAEVKVVPDMAEFVVTVREEGKDALEAQQKMTDKVNKLIELLVTVGVDKKDVQTEGYNTNPKYGYDSSACENGKCGIRERVIVGYEARESVSIKFRNLDKSGDVLTQIAILEISEVRGPVFGVSDDSKFKARAQAEAIEDAKNNAKVTAKNLGVVLGDIVSFQETPVYRDRYASMAMERVSSFAAPDIEVGQDVIKSSVVITYEVN